MTDRQQQLGRLQRALGHVFTDTGLLELALTHRSAGGRNNERLEFLGDSIINHIVAEALYHQFARASEGELSRMRASLVKGDTLARIARELDIGDYLVLGTGERKSGGKRRGSILADALEAIAGAILLDAGAETCRRCVHTWFDGRLEDLDPASAHKDAKTQLQEYLQGRGRPLPNYELLGTTGADHDQQFQVACRLTSPEMVVEGAGSSRRKAEQAAAGQALESLGVPRRD
ncbi:ribonuclease III [Pseudohalioglobus sediminis]|uniref:ribonuclease III n=1 Tax=Pseudohalioglobus sediminis TaxID=2606449 RepID=UPI0021D3668D|nr:ribonuclease III [Pseudohalioglobus sediminis]